MKLYTEEQVYKIIFKTKQWTNLSDDYLIAVVTPIELPSDEEMQENADNEWQNWYLNESFDIDDLIGKSYYINGFLKCYNLMKEQILNQNK